jgi:hypothetical protein
MESYRSPHAGGISTTSALREAMQIEVIRHLYRYNNQLNSLMAKETWTVQEE